MIAGGRRRNDPAQYDELVDEWWRPSGEFAALHWIAASRAEHIPPAVVARLGMELSELEELRDRLTSVIEAARREG